MNLSAMILALISSTLVTHMVKNKNRPMLSWIENQILQRFVPFLCMEPTTNLITEKVNNDETEEIRAEGSLSSGSQISSKSPKVTAITQDDDHEHVFRERKNDIYSNSKVNKWTQCAAVIERFFLILWILINFGSFGLIILMALGNNYKWEEMYLDTLPRVVK